MSANANEPMVHNVLEQQAKHEPDDPMTARMVAESISDQRALALRRLADASCQVLSLDDLQAAFGPASITAA